MKNLNYPLVFLLTALLSVTGAYEEVKYRQERQTVTLKPQQESKTVPHYMYWQWNEEELVYYNVMSGWSSPDEKWRTRVSMNNNELTIKNLKEDDFGTFTFSIFNEQTQTRNKVYTCHLIGITVNVKLSSPLMAGESQTLKCITNTPAKYRKPEIYWRNPQGQKQGVGQSVLIQPVTSQHNGDWTCVVKSDQEESTALIFVAVVEFSQDSSPHRFTSKSSPLMIPCSLPSNITWDQLKSKGIEEVQWQFSPKLPSGDLSGEKEKLYSLSLDNLQWEKASLEHTRNLETVPHVEKGNLSLTKRQGREKDRGAYECIMTFKSGHTVKRTVQVEVMQISASPGTNLTFGQQLNLTCGFGSALPSDMQLKLVPPGKSFPPHLNSDHHSASVSIPAVSTEHSGNWRCELWQGDKQLTSEMITLKIEPRLSVWMLVIISGAAVIVLLLLILFIFYWQKQQRMRHPRHQLCRCKHPKPKGFYKT